MSSVGCSQQIGQLGDGVRLARPQRDVDQVAGRGHDQAWGNVEVEGSGEEGGHLLPGHRIPRTKQRVIRRITTLSDPRSRQRPNTRHMHRTRNIRKRRRPGRQTQRPHQKRRHLLPGHRIPRTKQRVIRRITTLSDPRSRQRPNTRHMHRTRNIRKRRRPGRQTQRPHQKRRHLLPGHHILRTEQVIHRRITTLSNPRIRNRLDRPDMNRVVVVGEKPGGVCGPDHDSDNQKDN